MGRRGGQGGEVVVGGRVDPGVQPVVRVMMEVVMGMMGVEAVKAVGGLRSGEAAGRTGVRSPPQRVGRGHGGGRPQLDAANGLRDRGWGRGAEKERVFFGERARRVGRIKAD